MRDQADELRNMVSRTERDHVHNSLSSPYMIVMTGGKGGVGSTTLAVNFAASLSEQGARVVLVDANLHRGDVAALCGVEERTSVADVFSGRCDIQDVLLRGPAGIQIVPGVWAPSRLTEVTEKGQRRLIRQIQGLGDQADIVLLDVGNGGGDVLRRFWFAADEVFITTTLEPISVMDSYATIKSLLSGEESPSIQLLVNQVKSEAEAADVFSRLDRSCRRFLGLEIGLLGAVFRDDYFEAAASEGLPLAVRAPRNPAIQQIMNLSSKIIRKAGMAPSRSRRAA